MRGNPDGRERPSMQVWNPNDANRSSQVCELNLSTAVVNFELTSN